jgi:Rod binding domain-containing protein
MPKSFATQTFEEMYDEEVAKSISKGKGIGIADAMYRQMSYQLSKQYKVEE